MMSPPISNRVPRNNSKRAVQAGLRNSWGDLRVRFLMAILVSACSIGCKQQFCMNDGTMPSISVIFPWEAEAIPNSFNWPADRSQLEAIRDQNDISRMREHAWKIFAGITQLSADGRPIFESWYPVGVTLTKERSPTNGEWDVFFDQTRQFLPGATNKLLPITVGERPPAMSIFFNKEAFEFIRSLQLNLDFTKNKLKMSDTSDIPCFPNRAVVVKLAWWPIRRSGVSVVPVWDPKSVYVRSADWGLGNVKHPVGNQYTTWPTVVAVDPGKSKTNPSYSAQICWYDYTTIGGEDPAKKPLGPPREVPLVGFEAFHAKTMDTMRVTASDNGQINLIFEKLYGRRIEAGDYLLLVGVHIATKELEDWTWTTLWWDPRADEGEFGKDRIDQVEGRWRGFLMNTTMSLDLKPVLAMPARNIFNPWMEAPLSGGLSSNCVSCHQRSMWPYNPLEVPDHPDTGNTSRRRISRVFSKYSSRVGMDYIWALTRTQE